MRVNLIGASGSGATTIAQALSASLSIPHFESERYYHAPTDPPFQKLRPAHERFELISAELVANRSWVLCGGVDDWDPRPHLDFSLVIFLYAPPKLRLDRLRRRERERFGDRVLPGGDMHANHEAFIQWAAHYDAGDLPGKSLAGHEAYLARQNCPVFRFRNTLPLATIIRRVMASVTAAT